jgi:hypothetical protein
LAEALAAVNGLLHRRASTTCDATPGFRAKLPSARRSRVKNPTNTDKIRVVAGSECNIGGS